VAALAVLSACSSLPTSGPTTNEVIDQANVNGQRQFELINIDEGVLQVLQSQPQPTFRKAFGQHGLPPQPTIQVGDSVSILIWEAGGNGLFSQSTTLGSISGGGTGVGTGTGPGSLSPGARPTTIPDQIVMRDGRITIPFDGRVQAAGRTGLQLQDDVRQRLQGKAVDPQVIVSVTPSIASAVTVAGGAIKGAVVQVSPRGTRLLDVIAAAGGYATPEYETSVKLSRKGVTAAIPMRQLVDDPTENIYAWPGDTLTLERVPRVFEAFGATPKNAEIPFETENVSLAQALAKSSGLVDAQADPAGVFLLRYEPASVVGKLENTPAAAAGPAPVPVVYHLDMGNMKSYLLARRFQVKDKDIVYVANARTNSVQKFFQLLGTLTGPVSTAIVVTRGSP
jgi:polysaccharide export outer membrane protein